MRIVDWMLKNNVLLQELSKMTKIDRNALWDIITGNKFPTLQDAQKISDYSGGVLSVESLLLDSQKNHLKKRLDLKS